MVAGLDGIDFDAQSERLDSADGFGIVPITAGARDIVQERFATEVCYNQCQNLLNESSP